MNGTTETYPLIREIRSQRSVHFTPIIVVVEHYSNLLIYSIVGQVSFKSYYTTNNGCDNSSVYREVDR